MYQVYLLSSGSATFIKLRHDSGSPMDTFKKYAHNIDLRIKHVYIFGEVVVTTAFCIFNTVITISPHWRILGEIYIY